MSRVGGKRAAIPRGLLYLRLRTSRLCPPHDLQRTRPSSYRLRAVLGTMKATKQELTLAALVMIMLPIVGEAALRVTQVQFDPQLYTADQQRGWSLRAGARGLLADEGRQFIRINSHGFHDREHGYDKPANTIRIAVLGNSWTEGLQVSLEKTARQKKSWVSSGSGSLPSE